MNKTNEELFDSLTNFQIKAIKKLEKKANDWAGDSCNRQVNDATETRRSNIIENELKEIMGQLPEGFFINGDPRGYTLKVNPEKGSVKGLETDWGGYGILSNPIRNK